MSTDWIRKNERFLVSGIVLLAALHGLLYIYIVPPWQHNDEPMHFEYIWMIVNRGGLPEPEVYDWDFRADLVRSMIEHDFYRGLILPDPENLESLPAGLQFPQLDDPPLYYLFASLPVRAIYFQDLADQLVSARYASLVLLSLTIFSAWGIMSEITPPGALYRFLVPLTMAMLPGFIDLMTSVNNDVGAVAVFSFFLWGAIRVITGGPKPINLLWVFLAVLAAMATKSTAYLAAPLALVALVLGFLPGRFRRMAWIVIAVGTVLTIVSLLSFREPAFWYRATSQPEEIRTDQAGASHGRWALSLDPAAEITPRWLEAINQPLPLETVYRLQGRTITLGFWMWFSAAESGITALSARSPALHLDLPGGEDLSVSHQLTLASKPQFYSFQITVPTDALRIWVSASGEHVSSTGPAKLHFDGFVLAEGAYPDDAAALLNSEDDTAGIWGGAPFINLIRNGSAEQTWPAFRPWADNLSAGLLPSNVRLSILLHTLLDREGASWYYQGAAGNIFETFWGRFGWTHVPLPGGQLLYRIFAGATILAALGAALYPFEKGRGFPVDALVFLGLTLLVVWMAALARGAIFIFVEHVFLPSARYGFPAMIPSVLLLVAGWIGLGKLSIRAIRIPAFYLILIYVDFFLLLDIAALWGISRFYAGA